MTSSSDESNFNNTYPIEMLSKLSTSQLEVLKTRWLTTVDLFVAATATEQGRKGLCEVLGIEQHDLDSILKDARIKLGEKRYLDLIKGKPGGPLGVLLDDKNPGQVTNGSAKKDKNNEIP